LGEFWALSAHAFGSVPCAGAESAALIAEAMMSDARMIFAIIFT